MDAASLAEIRRLLDERLNWTAVIFLAARHRVRPLLYASLVSLKDNRVPTFVLEQLQAFAAYNARRNLRLVGRLFGLLDLFQSNDIPAIAFKGPLLAMSAYGNVSLREAGDLGLLVPRTDIAKARQLLTDCGFHPIFPTATECETVYLNALWGAREKKYLFSHGEHHLLDPRDGLNVDLHWSLALAEFCVLRDWKQPWQWMRRQSVAGRQIWGFDAEETLLILCINGAKDCWQRLDRICDVRELLERNPEMDWERAFITARRAGALRMVCLGIALAGDLLAARIPPQASRELESDVSLRNLIERIRVGLFENSTRQVEEAGFAKSLLHLRMRERWRDRIRYCLARLQPTVGDWAAMPLPTGMSWIYYLTRPLRLGLRMLAGSG